jgi:CubicO group peptidase (beta-lactamase class C family)
MSNSLAKINSCTKSILSALICIAIDREILPHWDTPISTFFPVLLQSSDQRKREITIAHLLTMSAGFRWNEFGGLNSFPVMTKQPDWIRHVLELPMADSPGEVMVYNSGCSQLLSAILRQASGLSTAEFAKRYLFGPLGIQNYSWERDPSGNHTGGFGLKLAPPDMLKFGQLFLAQGNWDGQNLLSREIVHQALKPALTASAPVQAEYGWHWWISEINGETGAGTHASLPYFYALGFGGQYIAVVPDLEVTAVVTFDKIKRRSQQVHIFRTLIAPLLLRTL